MKRPVMILVLVCSIVLNTVFVILSARDSVRERSNEVMLYNESLQAVYQTKTALDSALSTPTGISQKQALLRANDRLQAGYYNWYFLMQKLPVDSQINQTLLIAKSDMDNLLAQSLNQESIDSARILKIEQPIQGILKDMPLQVKDYGELTQLTRR